MNTKEIDKVADKIVTDARRHGYTAWYQRNRSAVHVEDGNEEIVMKIDSDGVHITKPSGEFITNVLNIIKSAVRGATLTPPRPSLLHPKPR